MEWIILILICLIIILWMCWNYFRLHRAANFVGNSEFAQLIRTGQLIDIRDPSQFHQKHISGARNFPVQQLKESVKALNPQKPVLIYDNNRGSLIPKAALLLKKEGFQTIYILEQGLDYWDGKVK